MGPRGQAILFECCGAKACHIMPCHDITDHHEGGKEWVFTVDSDFFLKFSGFLKTPTHGWWPRCHCRQPG